MVAQGDILSVEGIKNKLLVLSKNLINENQLIITVPIGTADENAIHLKQSSSVKGLVLCELVTTIDISVRGYKKVDQLAMNEMLNIVDTVQGLIDLY